MIRIYALHIVYLLLWRDGMDKRKWKWVFSGNIEDQNHEERPRERSDRGRFLPSGKKSLFIAGRTSMRRVIKIRKKTFFCAMSVWFNIVIGHLGRPYSTHTAPMPVLMGSVHAHILTKPSRAGFSVVRLELIEPGAETCLSSQGMLSYRSACPEIWRWFGY